MKRFYRNFNLIILSIFIVITLSNCSVKTTTLSKTFTSLYPNDSALIVYQNTRGVLEHTDFPSICSKVYEKFTNAKRGYIEKMHIEFNREKNTGQNCDTSKFKAVLIFTMNYDNERVKEGQDILNYYVDLLVEKK